MARPSVREKIVQAGLELFHRSGFNGSSVEDITDLAGVPKGSFYNHFRSKEALALVVVDRYVESGSQSLLVDATVPPTTRLKRYFGALADTFTRSNFKRGCLLGNFSSELADHSPPVRRRLEMAFTDWVRLIADVIKEAQAAGEIDAKVKAEQLASFLLSAFQGSLLRARAADDSRPLKEFASVGFNYLIK